ncbi:unnamed protein product [Discula destructiva]
MHLGFAVANIALLLLLPGFISALPGPWSVSQEHFEVLTLRQATPLNLDAVIDVECLDPEAHIVFHEQNTAQLAICNGISGAGNTRCPGASRVTEGVRGSANFTLTAQNPTAKINLSKVRWEECVRAARSICPTGNLSGTCRRAATSGDVDFRLESTMTVVDE